MRTHFLLLSFLGLADAWAPIAPRSRRQSSEALGASRRDFLAGSTAVVVGLGGQSMAWADESSGNPAITYEDIEVGTVQGYSTLIELLQQIVLELAVKANPALVCEASGRMQTTTIMTAYLL